MPLSPTETKQVLETLSHRPNKNLGQNFLVDGNIVRKSLNLGKINQGDVIVEIGPGLGTLTEALLESGCTVYAVEFDPTLAAHLRETIARKHPDHFHLKEGDALDFPLGDLPSAVDKFKIVANLPYAISTPWLEGILAGALPETLVLMLQEEAADRLTAKVGHKHYSPITIFLGLAYDKAGIHPVARQCFYPVPGVDSVLLHLQKKENPQRLPKTARQVIRKIFTQRRKQIGSLCRQQTQEHPDILRWVESLSTFDLDNSARPEVIPQEAWLNLSNFLSLHETDRPCA